MKYLAKHGLIIAALLFSFCISALWFRNGLPKATGESGLLFATIDKHFDITRYAWVDTTIGETPFSFNGAFPLFFVLKILSSTLTGSVIQMLFFGTTIFFGIIGVALLTQEVSKSTSRFAAFIAGVLYVFNPYSIVFVWNRFLHNYTLAYGLIPLLLLLWVRYLKTGNKWTFATFFFTCFLGSFAFTGISYLVCFGFAIAAVSAGLLIIQTERKKTLVRIFLIGIAFLFSQLFWLLPFYAGNRLGVGQSSSFFSEQGNLHTTMQLSEYYGGLFEKLTQIRKDMPALAYEGIPWAAWYSSGWIHVVSFIAPLLILVSLALLFFSKVRYKFIFGSLLGFLLLLVNGTGLPVGNLYLLIYKLHSTIQVLRNPYEKIGFLFYLVLFIIWGIGLSLSLKNKSRWFGKLFLSATLCWWFVMSVPIFNGVVFTYKYNVSKDPEVGFSLKVPNYYKDANEYVNETKTESRGLALPLTGEGITHTWEYGYDGVESYNALFTKPFISLDTTTGGLPLISRYIKNAPIETLPYVLPALNIGTVVVRHDLITPIGSSSPDTYSSILKNALRKEPTTFGRGALDIFTVPSAPRLFVTDNVRTQNNRTFDPLYLPKDGISVWEQNTQNESDKTYPQATFSELPSANNDTYADSQLLPPPHVSIQRDSPLYPLVRLKEWYWQLTHGYELSAVYSTLSFKRLAEISHLIDVKNHTELLAAIVEYKQITEPLLTEARNNIQENGGSRTYWELIFKSQEKMVKEYFNKSEGDQKVVLTDLLNYLVQKAADANIYPHNESKIKVTKDTFMKRLVFDLPKEGEWEINADTFSPLFQFRDEIQINKDIYPIVRHDNIPQLSFAKKFTVGKNEIRIPVQEIKNTLSTEELRLESINKNTLSKVWDVAVPEGRGEMIVSFEYKLVRGRGPKIEVFEPGAQKPILTESYPTDFYDFDWKQKGITVPFKEVSTNLKIVFTAEPTNDCQIQNPYDLKCLESSFQEVYNRHSEFTLKNIIVTYRPEVNVYLSQTGIEPLHTNATAVSWQKINPSAYKVSLKNATHQSVLTFLNQYHTGWKLYKTSSLPHGVVTTWGDYHSDEYVQSESPMSAAFMILRTFFASPAIAEQVMVNSFANGWKGLPDGEYLLAFAPQRLLYIGWIATLLFCVILIISLFINKHEKKKKSR